MNFISTVSPYVSTFNEWFVIFTIVQLFSAGFVMWLGTKPELSLRISSNPMWKLLPVIAWLVLYYFGLKNSVEGVTTFYFYGFIIGFISKALKVRAAEREMHALQQSISDK